MTLVSFMSGLGAAAYVPPVASGAAYVGRLTMPLNSTVDGAGERTTATFAPGALVNGAIAALFAIGKNFATDTFAFAAGSPVLHNGTSGIAPFHVQVVEGGNQNRRALAVAVWPYPGEGTYSVRFTPAGALRYAGLGVAWFSGVDQVAPVKQQVWKSSQVAGSGDSVTLSGVAASSALFGGAVVDAGTDTVALTGLTVRDQISGGTLTGDQAWSTGTGQNVAGARTVAASWSASDAYGVIVLELRGA